MIHPERSLAVGECVRYAEVYIQQCQLFGMEVVSGERREDKIERYRAMKGMKDQMEKVLKERQEKGACVEEWEGEGMREYCILEMKLNLQLCFENKRFCGLEKTLIEEHEKRNEGGPEISKRRTEESKRERKVYNGPLLDQNGKALRPFTITGRKAVQEGVFRYGHNLPTMSIDEYLAKEAERGNFLSGGGKMNKKDKEEEDLDSDEVIKKLRDWDAFKDENPSGLGNRYNRG